MDVGWRRTAALWGARNPETDVLYLWHEYYRGETEPPIHADAIRRVGEWIPGVIDPAAHQRSQRDGVVLMAQYQELGLNLSPAQNAVTAGIYDVWTRLSTGRIKVFRTLAHFLQEYRIYRRDEKGGIVKENDHLMDCLRYEIASGLAVGVQTPIGIVAEQRRSGHTSAYEPMAEMFTVS